MHYRNLCLAILSVLALSASAASPDITAAAVKKALNGLDLMFEHRQSLLDKRMDLIKARKKTASERPSVASLQAVAQAYVQVNNDSALSYYEKAIEKAAPDSGEQGVLLAASAALLPLSGFIDPAMKRYEDIDTTAMTQAQKVEYYDSGRQMYANLTAFYALYPDVAIKYSERVVELSEKLLAALSADKESPRYRLAYGEWLLRTRRPAEAEAVLKEVYTNETEGSQLRTRAAHILSHIASRHGDCNAHLTYLIDAVRGDLLVGNVELLSLQDLGTALHDEGDKMRAYRYLNVAMADASQAANWIRSVQASRAFPMVQQSHATAIASKESILKIAVGALVLTLMALIVGIVLLRRESRRQRSLQHKLSATNTATETYLIRLMTLCSEYLENLSHYSVALSRKLSAGKTEEVAKSLKSGKFIAEQSTHFFDVFDNAFLHLYPNFVNDVNALLRPEARIELREGERLNTDLRILAFMRMGIDDSGIIARLLNYSVNTIYTYRNKLKTKAINRDTFEADIMLIARKEQQ